ncbi:hypothetical protein EWM64_g9116 [Hericium alpestre]|uniref:YCII-related domain-containing protein n=1 Tax=Hericium alpestre TaxID=135208 RepID=A0A4Y9ZJC1_9AGAM|nr:hypothetical protein EWM64_g9116 [Hericium alpestre]
MSSTNTPKPHFLVYAPDNTDPDAGSRRRSDEATHVAHMVDMKESGILVDVGIMVAPEPLGKSVQDPNMVGTYLVIEASTLEEAKEIVQKDPFWDANVVSAAALVRVAEFC